MLTLYSAKIPIKASFESSKILHEFDELNLRSRVGEVRECAVSEIQEIEVLIEKFHEDLDENISCCLLALGETGQKLHGKMTIDVQQMFESFLAIYGSKALAAKMEESSQTHVTKYVNLVFGHFETLSRAIGHNPTSIKCWDNNQKQFKIMIDNLFKNLKDIISDEMRPLKEQLPGILKNIGDEVSLILDRIKKIIVENEQADGSKRKDSGTFVSLI